MKQGVAGTGIVAFIQGEDGEGLTIGPRAAMDALPIHEAAGSMGSEDPGKMHACRQTAILLGAPKYLVGPRKFRGNIQTAEEVELPSGGLKLVEDGLLDRFDISQVLDAEPECRGGCTWD